MAQALVGRQGLAAAARLQTGLQGLRAVRAGVGGGPVVRQRLRGRLRREVQLPVEEVVLPHVQPACARAEHGLQRGVVRLVEVAERDQLRVEGLELVGQRGQELVVVVSLFDASHRVLVLNLPPGELSGHELDQHVEQGPEVVLSAELLPAVRGGAGVADSPSKRRSVAPGPHFPGGQGELPRQTEVQQVYGVAGGGAAPDCEVAGLDVSVQEAALVDSSDRFEGLRADPQRGGEREFQSVLSLPQVRQTRALESHHQVVELGCPAATHELARVFAACGSVFIKESDRQGNQRPDREGTHPESS